MKKLAKLLFYVGDVVLFLTGALHLMAHFSQTSEGANEEQRKLFELLATVQFTMPSGELRTYDSIFSSFSLYFAIFPIAMALMVWIAARSRATFKPSLAVGTLAMLVITFVTYKYAFMIPLVMVATTAVCFLIALLFARSDRDS